MSETVANTVFILGGFVAVAILLKVLLFVHHQTGKIKQLETQMKAMEKIKEMQVKSEEENNG